MSRQSSRLHALLAPLALGVGLAAQAAPAPAPLPGYLPYSTQRTVLLDPREVCSVRVAGGEKCRIQLLAVREHRDEVVGLIRHAEVDVAIDDEPVTLECGPYVMPTEVAGIRVLADTTSGWLPLDKRVQLSVWDAKDPIVDTRCFRFPLEDYRLFSHGTQAYNEPVHLGLGDDDPKGGFFYHNYGFDLAGYEGETRVVSCTAGTVLRVFPAAEPYAVAIEDAGGLVWEYQHLDAVDPSMQPDAKVEAGQRIGIVGRKGGAGNFAHLHVGTYRSRARFDANDANRRHNLYPWLVTAHEAERRHGLYAVARPHRQAVAGSRVVLDGRRSIAFGRRIAAYRWEIDGHEIAPGPTAEVSFTEPGCYIATLWVEDDTGLRDVDFCRIRVFSKQVPEPHIPTIFMSHFPAAGIRPDQPVRFRCWLQQDPSGPLDLDFGDGTVVKAHASYTPIEHTFAKAGIHVVSASTTVGSLRIQQKQSISVESPAGSDREEPAARAGAPATRADGRAARRLLARREDWEPQ